MGLTRQPRTTYWYELTCDDCKAIGSNGHSDIATDAVKHALRKSGFTVDVDDDGGVVFLCSDCAQKR